MSTRIEDRAAITDLMTGWIHRDLGEWDRLRGLFHPDATIAITWFDGLATTSSTAPPAWAPLTCVPNT